MERNIRTEAIILSSRRMGDLHRSVTLLSPNLGILQAAAFGAQKGKSKLSGWVEPYVSGTFNLYYNPVKQQYKIVDIDSCEFREFLRLDVYAFYLASFWSELIIKTYAGGGEYSDLYNLILESLSVLGVGREADNHNLLVQTIWRFLTIIGYAPELVDCPECGKTLDNSETLVFDADSNAFLCSMCGTYEELVIYQGARKYLLYTQELSVKDAVAVHLSSKAMDSLKKVLISLVLHVVGGPLKTLQSGIL
ncbi:MAG: DNA repair protein RecO [Bacteroidetes bacterium]|nr:DNA repair protein RecO [Bacteroidota bacterium]